MKLLRLLHLYLSMLGFVLMAFFAVTGFMLNHQDYFGLDEVRSEKTWSGNVDRELAHG